MSLTTDDQPDRAAWPAVSTAYGDAVRDYYLARGHAVDEPAVQTTIQTNTERVPQRGDHLLKLMEQLTGVTALTGRSALEVGCGFGALAGYLAWSGQPAHMTGIDVREEFVQTAQDAANRLGLDGRLTFERGDMTNLSTIADASVDVVLVNNALIYVTTKSGVRQALREFARVLRPGGVLVVYHANRWRLREPFTKDPIVHLLPPRVADVVSRVTGWRHNHGRVLLLSPPALSRLARRSGFTDVRTTPGRISDFYGLGARRAAPETPASSSSQADTARSRL
jgi:ubiquinone/menaquinone biosynthesis C-methylase UbiE